MPDKSQPEHPPEPVVLDNENCPYCGKKLDQKNATKEHVIGRRFVPRGQLAVSWNLILKACRACNHRKSDLEDDISAISLQPDAYERLARTDAGLAQDSSRKAMGCISRLTGLPVAHSAETVTLEFPSAADMTISLVLNAPPQLDPSRVCELARFHTRALFYYLTFDPGSSRGRFWPGWFAFVDHACRPDWGNCAQRAFAQLVVGWSPRLVMAVAGAFFKAAIRQHPDAICCWSWALEWNENVRVIGFFGEEAPVREVALSLPRQEATLLSEELTSDGSTRRVLARRDIPLAEEEDMLFDLDLGASARVD